MSDAIPRPITLFAQAIGALALIAAVGWYVEGWLDYRSARTWPTVPGTVLSTDVEISGSARSSTTNINERNRDSGGGSYIPLVRYRYVAAGRERQGDAILLNNAPIRDSMDEAKAFLADYPVGGAVTALVNPQDPDQAVLEANPPDAVGYAILAFFGLVFGGTGTLLSRLGRKASAHEPPV